MILTLKNSNRKMNGEKLNKLIMLLKNFIVSVLLRFIIKLGVRLSLSKSAYNKKKNKKHQLRRKIQSRLTNLLSLVRNVRYTYANRTNKELTIGCVSHPKCFTAEFYAC